MTHSQNSASSLLPNGLLDLLPPEAELEASTIEGFMAAFGAFGYKRVKPPLVEFEESLLGGGPGQKLARQTFRMMDPVSQRMMGVRADMTAQIARIAASRLQGETRPLRLSYAGDVLRVNGTQLRPERQFAQVGCELIGEDSVEADVELALLALKALHDGGIKGLSIDLTVPTTLLHLYDEAAIAEDERVALDDLIEKRDTDALQKHSSPIAHIMAELLACEGVSNRSVSKLERLKLSSKAAADIAKLSAVAKGLQSALDVYGLKDIQITVSPLERRGFEYQTGTSFTLFAKESRGELGRGGRYEVAANNGETATGFTLYMDSVLPVVPVAGAAEERQVSAKDGWAEIKALQDQGQVVSRKG